MIPKPSSVKVLTAAAAAQLVAPEAVVTISGAAGNLVPDALLRAIRQRFDQHGEPYGLTAICPVAVGDVFEIPGLDHLASPRLLSTIVCGSYVYGRRPDTGEEPEITKLVLSGKIAAYNFGIGVVYNALRESAANRPGLITRIGLGTFQDPRDRGGRLHDTAPQRFVTVCPLDGEEYLRYQFPAVDVALVRGSTADEFGNISAEREPIDGGIFVQALAAHNRGGKVIVQVERLTEGRALPARSVVIPGVLVDAVVIAPGEKQATGVEYDPYLSGELRAPNHRVEALSDPIERAILDRAVERLPGAGLVILGFGIPSRIPDHPRLPEGLRFCVEHGAIGGSPAVGLQFGGARNAEALIDTPSMFDLIDGGGCDMACLGFSEVASDGSVNVSRLPNAIPGSGGFTNITASTREILYCGAFTAGGLKVEYQGDSVRILQEGRFKKFVRAPREITFNATRNAGIRVTYVTDRCIIERRGERLVVTAVYPGIDLQRDILAQSEFELGVEV
ncbi:acyl CoA:acetate/3-ketoacid CoA transferase [bacterium]|nr:MAG: acyl CoA:acetate/3-ketoacid CoA transferase [bacterium]